MIRAYMRVLSQMKIRKKKKTQSSELILKLRLVLSGDNPPPPPDCLDRVLPNAGLISLGNYSSLRPSFLWLSEREAAARQPTLRGGGLRGTCLR